MIEVFTTDVKDQNQANEILKLLEQNHPELRVNFDFSDRQVSAFACMDNILRVEGPYIDASSIISSVQKAGFRCDVLPDRICR